MKKSKRWTLKWHKHFALLFGGLAFGAISNVNAQNQPIPLNQQYFLSTEAQIMKSDQIVHSSFKPLVQQQLSFDSQTLERTLPNLSFGRKSGSWVGRKLFREHLVLLDTGEVQLSIDPIVNFELGEEQREDPREDPSLYKNTRGFLLRINLGKQFSVVSTFRENQAVLPYYVSQRTQSTSVAYGQGRVKNLDDGGYDFSMASSRIVYSPHERVNIQIGHGKHFVGEGHRSLLLSDMAFNYPYLKLQTSWFDNKMQYQNLFTLFQDLQRLDTDNQSEGLFERKRGSFHYLNFKPSNNFSFGVFEGLIYPSLDTSGNIKVGANYWVPLIGLNTLIEGDENAGNSLQGINLSYVAFSKLKLYSQIAFHDEEVSEMSYQIGGKLFVADHLVLQAELNQRAKNIDQSLYHHYSESLSYPINQEVREVMGAIYLNHGRFQGRVMGNHFEGENYQLSYLDVNQAYLINPSSRLAFNVGFQYREVSEQDGFTPAQPSSLYFYVGLTTNFQNLYFNY